jgi:xylan 1,4-beta-xylosidase
VQRYVIDSTHSNSYAAWSEIGQPQHPSDEQIRLMKLASRLQPVARETVGRAPDGKFHLDLILEAHAVCLLKCTPV